MINKEPFITKILSTTILVLVGFGIIINIIHFFEIRESEVVNFDSTNLESIRLNLDETKSIVNNLDIDSYNGNISDEHLNILMDNINISYNNLRNLTILNYSGNKKLTVKDKFNIIFDNVNNSNITSFANSYAIISKYDKDLKDIKSLMMPNMYINMLSLGTVEMKIINNFNYRINNYTLWYMSNPINNDIEIIISYYHNQSESLKFITNWLSKELRGENNE